MSADHAPVPGDEPRSGSSTLDSSPNSRLLEAATLDTRARVRRFVLVVGLIVLVAGCVTHPEVDTAALVRSDDVTIEFDIDTCNADLTATVAESETTVEVTITAENDTTDDCRDHIVITLENPLGDRRLVNGASGDDFQRRSEPPDEE